MHGRFLAQPVEIRPERIGPEQLGVADVDVFKRNGIGLVPNGPLMGVRGEIDCSVHRRLLMIRLRGWLRKRDYCANYIPLRAPEQGRVLSPSAAAGHDSRNAPFSATSARDKLICKA